NPLTVKVLWSMSSDFYNSLFSTPISTPEIFVDNGVWDSIKSALPEDYALPNPLTVKVLWSMSSDFYN
ncbi:hypothetical protein, partial [Priestia megaterium]|uniref:hypothetical protein n=1 Tax=Priestia megaterium TaxID=1404 RepID=UPI00203B8E16